MASPVGDTLVRPSSISPPPPVYLRASPPPQPPSYDPPAIPGHEDAGEQPAAHEIRKKSPPVSAININHEAHIQRSPQSPVHIDGSAFDPQGFSAAIEGSNYDLDSRFSTINLSDPAPASTSRSTLPPRIDSIPAASAQTIADRHASASTGSWSLVGNEKEDGSKRTSTDQQGVAQTYHNSNSITIDLSVTHPLVDTLARRLQSIFPKLINYSPPDRELSEPRALCLFILRHPIFELARRTVVTCLVIRQIPVPNQRMSSC
ncbi:hypothetical protein F66182_14512 [Fusarium sp. NRRL 66182]|nr:hypothetical protein F66182_14512 [Fusarium sp. NRRL 66182]